MDAKRDYTEDDNHIYMYVNIILQIQPIVGWWEIVSQTLTRFTASPIGLISFATNWPINTYLEHSILSSLPLRSEPNC